MPPFLGKTVLILLFLFVLFSLAAPSIFLTSSHFPSSLPSLNHKSHQHNHFLHSSTTFFSSIIIIITMISQLNFTSSSLPFTPLSSSKPKLSTTLTFHNVAKNTIHFKPLYLSSTQNFSFSTAKRVTECHAYEADRSESEPAPLAVNIDVPVEPVAQKMKIGLYFATWWALNVVFNIYNKKVLNAFPYPWLTSTLSLAAGSLIMLISWATRVADVPKVDFDFWKALFPVSMQCCFVFYEYHIDCNVFE